MKPRPVLPLACLAFIAARLAVLAVNACTFPRLRPAPPGTPPTPATLLIPMRNEAANVPRFLPGVLDQLDEHTTLLILDDHSTDGTAGLCRALIAAHGQHDRAQVMAGADLPPGWGGKAWACAQLADLALQRDALLVFTDADVLWAPGALRAVLAERRRQRVGLLTVLPRPLPLPLGAEVLTPLVDEVVLSWLPFPLLRTRPPLLTTANGQLLLLTPHAYRAAGGHAGVRAAMLEDTTLARHAKAAGLPVGQALGGHLIGVQMYASYGASVRGFAKNAVAVHLGSRALMLALGAAYTLTHTLSFLLPGPLWRLVAACSLLERPLVALLTGRGGRAALRGLALSPLTAPLAWPAYALALRGRVPWKGRLHPEQT